MRATRGSNFQNKMLDRKLARDLVYAMVDLLPVIGSPTPAMVDLLHENLGWSILYNEDPGVNVWSSFTISAPNVPLQRFAVGGMMRLGMHVGARGITGTSIWWWAAGLAQRWWNACGRAACGGSMARLAAFCFSLAYFILVVGGVGAGDDRLSASAPHWVD